jgi:hypothetical protein
MTLYLRRQNSSDLSQFSSVPQVNAGIIPSSRPRPIRTHSFEVYRTRSSPHIIRQQITAVYGSTSLNNLRSIPLSVLFTPVSCFLTSCRSKHALRCLSYTGRHVLRKSTADMWRQNRSWIYKQSLREANKHVCVMGRPNWHEERQNLSPACGLATVVTL